jgi:hypothetical protein
MINIYIYKFKKTINAYLTSIMLDLESRGHTLPVKVRGECAIHLLHEFHVSSGALCVNGVANIIQQGKDSWWGLERSGKKRERRRKGEREDKANINSVLPFLQLNHTRFGC